MLAAMIIVWSCAQLRERREITGANLTVLTYNDNWGMPSPDIALRLIEEANADIVSLQQTTPEW